MNALALLLLAAISQLMHEAEVPGVSIARVEGGTIAWLRHFVVMHAETRQPGTDATIFEAASLAKPLFAYAVMDLATRGAIDLDRPLIEYLPEPVSDERMKTITARMVLAHTTGFQNEVMPGDTLRLQFTPGERFSAIPVVFTNSGNGHRIGYVLLDRKRVPDAIAVFRLNVQRFPGSCNAYDSLDEAYAAAGDVQNAIASYERSLELDPKNTNAVEMLKALTAIAPPPAAHTSGCCSPSDPECRRA